MPGIIAAKNPQLAAISTVEIEERGSFYYILCKAYVGSKTADFVYIVRGSREADFHCEYRMQMQQV